jgi:hypothetical protein
MDLIIIYLVRSPPIESEPEPASEPEPQSDTE